MEMEKTGCKQELKAEEQEEITTENGEEMEKQTLQICKSFLFVMHTYFFFFAS